MINKIFETVSFHLVKPCDYSCKFCYTTFNDFKVNKQLTIMECRLILERLWCAGVRKVTFAGSEPMLYPHIKNVIWIAKELGFTTSIISNGSMLTKGWLNDMRNDLDWVGISIDSINPTTNKKIGRERDNGKQTDYEWLINEINHLGYKLKINTVVNTFNKGEDIHDFIKKANPSRWKVFQALKVIGQNDAQFDKVKVSQEEFDKYCMQNFHPSMVIENNELLGNGSYLLIDPLGRMFEDSKGVHTYSDSLAYNTVDHCLSQINLNREMFIKRGGIYKW